MIPLCEFCGVARAIVYCTSDSAHLCLSCDGYVHGANALSQRHLRSLICDNCHSQPAIIRCIEDKMSFCENCSTNVNCCLDPGHHRQTLSSYSGCPTISEPSKEINTRWGQQSIITVNENCVTDCWEPGQQQHGLMITTKLKELESCVSSEPWTGPSSSVVPPNVNSLPRKRVKGRFVKAGEDYDYDPLTERSDPLIERSS